jgi:hypothetical protein
VTTKPDGEKPSADEPARSPPQTSAPEIRIGYKPAGRETLEAITGELVPLPGAYERASSSPEISVREGVIERDTLAAIMEEAGASFDVQQAPAPAAPATAPKQPASPAPTASAAEALEVFEMVTFVVRGGDVARLASEGLRRKFVEEHLLQRLPVKSMAEVERVDVTPWTVQGTLVVRVWCKAKTS